MTKTYGSGFRALKGIDLDVAEGASSRSRPQWRRQVQHHRHPFDLGEQEWRHGWLATTWIATVRLQRCLGVVPQEFNFNQFEKAFDILVTQAGYYGIPAKIAKERRRNLFLNQLGLGTSVTCPRACSPAA